MLKIGKYHKSDTRHKWVQESYINFETEENFEKWYKRCIESTNCELCNESYKSCNDRNIVCTKCNNRKLDIEFSNNTGHRYICKAFSNSCKQGFTYIFQIQRDGKKLVDKSSVDLDKLIIIRDNWIRDNPHHFS